MNICPKCGLPKEACICETLAKEKQKIQIQTVKKKYGKLVTILSGIEDKSLDLNKIAKELKSELACGGTVKEGHIELQGDHLRKVKEKLIAMGFSAEIL
jgi:translation initiation factor 1